MSDLQLSAVSMSLSGCSNNGLAGKTKQKMLYVLPLYHNANLPIPTESIWATFSVSSFQKNPSKPKKPQTSLQL